jgi:hypothetical protein
VINWGRMGMSPAPGPTPVEDQLLEVALHHLVLGETALQRAVALAGAGTEQRSTLCQPKWSGTPLSAKSTNSPACATSSHRDTDVGRLPLGTASAIDYSSNGCPMPTGLTSGEAETCG